MDITTIIEAGALGVVVLLIVLIYQTATKLTTVLSEHLKSQREMTASAIQLHNVTHTRLVSLETQINVLIEYVKQREATKRASNVSRETKKEVTKCKTQ